MEKNDKPLGIYLCDTENTRTFYNYSVETPGFLDYVVVNRTTLEEIHIPAWAMVGLTSGFRIHPYSTE